MADDKSRDAELKSAIGALAATGRRNSAAAVEYKFDQIILKGHVLNSAVHLLLEATPQEIFANSQLRGRGPHTTAQAEAGERDLCGN